ncbi:MAG: type II toxin-antitoxin system PemK/MazF family toxin [Burkholderiales bacterium]
MRCAEIWWASFPNLVGSEPSFQRPCCVVSANAFNGSRIGTMIAVVFPANVWLPA